MGFLYIYCFLHFCTILACSWIPLPSYFMLNGFSCLGIAQILHVCARMMSQCFPPRAALVKIFLQLGLAGCPSHCLLLNTRLLLPPAWAPHCLLAHFKIFIKDLLCAKLGSDCYEAS